MHEQFDHTADLGLRVRAADLNALFAEAGEALLGAIVENPGAVEPKEELTIELPGDDLEFLLIDWLQALLVRFEADGLLCSRFDVHVGDGGLRAAVRGEAFDPSRHAPAHEVKAVTYHDVKLERAGDGWLAEVIVDI